ncbi:MAG: hypothetical protein AB7P40_25445 [Chloroflexota bacterium]
MMAELGYRPAAPSDGFGNITVPTAELETSIEAREYARRFAEEEDEGHFWGGCTDYRFSRAAILALEAFRLCNSGTVGFSDDEDASKLVPALLRRAADEYERAVRESNS